MKTLFRALALVLAFTATASAQSGQIASGRVWGNVTPGSAIASPVTVTSLLDVAFNPIQGTMLVRGASAWAGSATPTLGLAGTTAGKLLLSGVTSGVVTLQTAAAAGTWSLTLPTSGGTSGYVLSTNGSGVTSWVVNGGGSGSGTVTSVDVSGGTTGLTASGGPVTVSGTITLAGTLVVANGGTGRTTLTNHGVLVGATASAITQLSVGATGSLLAGATGADPAFSSTPTLGIAGTTKGTLAFSGNTSGVVTVQPAAAAGTWSFTWPTSAGTSGQVLQTDGAGVTSWTSSSGAGTVTSVTCGTGLSGGTITVSGTCAFATIANNTILGNVSGSTAVPIALTQAQAVALIAPNTFNVTCDVTGAVDCSSAINTAVTAAITNLGGTVRLPCGIILVNTGITIASGITLEGCGYEDYATTQTADTPGVRGTYLYQTSGSNPAITIGSTANGVVIRKMACRQLQPADTGGWTPTAYQPCIQALGNTSGVGTSLVEDFGCMGVYKCYMSGNWGGAAQRSRNRLNRVQADCYNICFYISYSADTDRLTDIHIWPFVNLNNANIITYQRASSVGFYLDRQDNGEYTNIYIFGVAQGMYMSSCGALCSVNSLEIVNYNCDACVIGINDQSVRSPGFMMKLSNIALQSDYGSASPSAVSRGIVMDGANARYQITNLSTTFMALQAISISGANSDVALTNWNTYYWNMAAVGAAGMNCAATVTCTITGRWLMEAGGGGPTTGGAGTFQYSHAN